MKIECFHNIDEISEAYDSIFENTGKHSFFLTKGWFSIVERNALPGDSCPLYVGIRDDHDRAIGLVPLLIHSSNRKTPYASGLTCVYTQDFRPLLHSDDMYLSDILNAFVDWLMTSELTWSTLDFKFLTVGDTTVDALRHILSTHRVIVKSYAQYENWHYPVVVEDGASYIANLSKKLRGDIRRQQKKLVDDNRLIIELSTNDENLERLLKDFESVYENSWKGSESSPDFVPSIARWCAKNGSSRLAVAYIDGQAAGAQFWIVHEGCAYIYKVAYIETFKNTSIGSILTAYLATHVIDQDQVKKIDFGVGSEPYKRRWMSHCNQKHGIIIFNCRTVKGLVYGIRQKLIDVIGRLIMRHKNDAPRTEQ